MTLDNPVIAVIIPAYRCETTILSVLENIPAIVNPIIVVEDASPDHTAALVETRAGQDPRVHLVRHGQNQGVGGAMITGYRAALALGADLMVKMDSDGQMAPQHLPALIEPLCQDRADYTKGNRFLHDRDLWHMPWIRRTGNLGLSFLTKVASGHWHIFDPTNGYTAITAAAYTRLDESCLARRFFFETSMLIETGINRLVVKDVDIPARYAGETSSLSEWRAFFEFPPRLLRGTLRRIVTLYFVRDFTAVTIFLLFGLLSVAFGGIWGLYYWVKGVQSGVPNSTGTVMIAVLPLMLGLQMLLQAVVMDIQNAPKKEK